MNSILLENIHKLFKSEDIKNNNLAISILKNNQELLKSYVDIYCSDIKNITKIEIDSDLTVIIIHANIEVHFEYSGWIASIRHPV